MEVIDSLYFPRLGAKALVEGEGGGPDIVDVSGASKADCCWGSDGGTCSKPWLSSLAGTDGAGLFSGVFSSGLFGKLIPSCASLPLTQQLRQKYLPRRPMWHANSLCIGLSPNKARTVGNINTISLCTQSQAHIPSRWADLQIKSVLWSLETQSP